MENKPFASASSSITPSYTPNVDPESPSLSLKLLSDIRIAEEKASYLLSTLKKTRKTLKRVYKEKDFLLDVLYNLFKENRRDFIGLEESLDYEFRRQLSSLNSKSCLYDTDTAPEYQDATPSRTPLNKKPSQNRNDDISLIERQTQSQQPVKKRKRISLPVDENLNIILPVTVGSGQDEITVYELENRVKYTSKILDGTSGPIFSVVCEDLPDQEFTASSASAAWKPILERLVQEGLPVKLNTSGPQLFGLGNLSVAKAIQELEGSEKCTKYLRYTWSIKPGSPPPPVKKVKSPIEEESLSLSLPSPPPSTNATTTNDS
ncbi:hypothetical protein BB560_007175 [Smittium megazygosporum]|uniref:Uncharacterized protein n=1 Tax=Smittium megazygosporum TaxID=133381 RepID=A0A2T9XY75_9FUNG|nr:hypothetical protein BB560_007175 [Smittium megazygosporum]